MNFRLWLTSVLMGLASAAGVQAQMVTLTEAPLKDACVRNELTMDLVGKITVKQNGKDQSYPHKAEARHVYLERFLEINGPVADKAARFYTAAESVISFNNMESSKSTLRDEFRLMMAQHDKDHVVSYSARGMLVREEMELTEHFNTLAVSGLLPGKQVTVGDSWKVPNHAVTALANLSGLTNHSLEGKLTTVQGEIAHGNLVGNVQGIDAGAQVSMIINARFEFDMVEKRIRYLEWKQTDDRKQGPINPALTAEVTFKLKRAPVQMPNELIDLALVKFPAAPPSELTNIRHVDRLKRFTLQYARDWHVTSSDDSPQLVMRLMERGDFVVQATITPLKKTKLDKIMTLKEFADLMESFPGWENAEVSERTDIENLPKHHYKTYRVSASGDLDGVKTWQTFYLVVGRQGDQTIVTFSATPMQAKRVGTRDLELIRDLAFPTADNNP